jgi:hypothetical protein
MPLDGPDTRAHNVSARSPEGLSTLQEYLDIADISTCADLANVVLEIFWDYCSETSQDRRYPEKNTWLEGWNSGNASERSFT